MVILEYSKLTMYKFYYEKINILWPLNEIIGYETDSFFLNTHTDDAYKDIKTYAWWFWYIQLSENN